MRPGDTHVGFHVQVEWAAQPRKNTRNARSFSRDHTVTAPGPGTIDGSSAPEFKGATTRWNPEQLLLAATAQCHMMTFLFLAHQEGLRVDTYDDHATGTVALDADGIGGRFSRIELHPRVRVRSQPQLSTEELHRLVEKLHQQTPQHCFIARSLDVPVVVTPHTEVV